MTTNAINHLLHNPGGIDEMGRTCLHYAALHMSEVGILEMIHGGINPNIVDCQGHTALHLLLQHQTANPHALLALVRFLLLAGANPNVGYPGSVTPLMLAVLTTHVPLVQVLCEFGADVNVRFHTSTPLLFPDKMTALSLAATTEQPLMIKMLKRASSLDPTTTFHALQKASPSMKSVLMYG